MKPEKLPPLIKHIYQHLPPTFLHFWDFLSYSIQARRRLSQRCAVTVTQKVCRPQTHPPKRPTCNRISLTPPLCHLNTQWPPIFSLVECWMASSSVYISAIMSFMIIDVFVLHIRTIPLTKQMQIYKTAAHIKWDFSGKNENAFIIFC